MNVSTALTSIVWDKLQPGMLVVLHRPKARPALALVTAGEANRASRVDFLPLHPADEDWRREDGFSNSNYVLAHIENAIVQPLSVIPDGSSVGGLASIPSGALVQDGTDFMIAGRSAMGADDPRPGYDPATGAVRPLSGRFWFNRWSIFVPSPHGSELIKVCDCSAAPQKSASTASL